MHFGFALDSSDIDLLNIDLLDTHLDLLDTDIPSKQFVCLQDVFKTSSIHVFNTSSRHVFKTSSSHVFKTSSRRLQGMSWRSLQDVLKTNRFLLGMLLAGHTWFLRIINCVFWNEKLFGGFSEWPILMTANLHLFELFTN